VTVGIFSVLGSTTLAVEVSIASLGSNGIKVASALG
jgi:hypothetical protein